ncbi:YacL family protein [Vibrio sp. PP-XX7]
MDYEFKKNALEGGYYCQCSMGHEIVGRWLQDEIGQSQEKINQIFELIRCARQQVTQEHQWLGKEISLVMCGDEVTVQDNAMAYQDVPDNPEAFEFYDSESISCCGLEDFERLMIQWQTFIFPHLHNCGEP